MNGASDLVVSEALRAALTGGAFLLLFALAETWRRLGSPPVEWTRKLVHFGGGIIAAFFPWIFASHWTVLALGAAFLLILWSSRRLGLLPSVHGVARRSQGGIYFPIAIYLVFLLGADRPVFYLISILVLVVADAAAAVLGSTYGRTQFDVERDRRSLEGSAVFFFSTFLIVHLPLLLLTDIPRQTSVLVGVQLALIVTLLEAISLEGNDNLIVPLATFFLLHKLTVQTPETLAFQLVAQVAIIVLLGLVAWRYAFVTASGALALSLFFYGAYSLAGPHWIVGPAFGLLAFALFYGLRAAKPAEGNARYQVVAAFYVCIVPTLLFLAHNFFATVLREPAWLAAGEPFYPLFLGACAAQLALIGWNLEPRAGGGVVGMPGWLRERGLGGGSESESESESVSESESESESESVSDSERGSGSASGSESASGSASASAKGAVRPALSWAVAGMTVVAAVVSVVVPGAAAGGLAQRGWQIALVVAVLGPAAYHGSRRLRWWPQHPPWNVRLQAASVALTVLAVLPLWIAMTRQ